MSNSNSWNLKNVKLSEDKINKNIKETTKQINLDVNLLINMIKKYDYLELLKFTAFHVDEILEKSKVNKNIHNEEIAYSQLRFMLKYIASNPNSEMKSTNFKDFSWKKFNRTYSTLENHVIKYTDNLILREKINPKYRTRMQELFYSYMFPTPKVKFEDVDNKVKQLKLILQPHVDKINATFDVGFDGILDSLRIIAKVGTKGIYDLNQDCEVFASKSQKKIENLKKAGDTNVNSVLLSKIVEEENWGGWLEKLQNRSEKFDLFDVQILSKLESHDLDLLSVETGSQYSENFGWITESAGIDNSLFIKKDGRYYSFDSMFIFDKAYEAIKRAVIKSFPGYENTWNSIEMEKSGLLPVSIFAGVFGHFNYQLSYEVEDSYFTAEFENDSNNVFIQVPRQHGYKLPMNPIKEIGLLDTALHCYDSATSFFDKIDGPIVVLDYYDESGEKIVKKDDIYYISYLYLSSILNDWNEIRLLKDQLLGVSSSSEAEDLSKNDDDNLIVDDKDCALDLQNEEGNCTLNDKVESDLDIEEEIEPLEGCLEVTDSNMDEMFENNPEPTQEDSEDYSDRELLDTLDGSVVEDVEDIEDDAIQNDGAAVSSGFSFFDVLNNVAKGKDPLNNKQEDESIEDTTAGDLDSNKDLNPSIEENKKKEDVSDIEKEGPEGSLEDHDDRGQEKIQESKPSGGFSFFDVLNNVAKGKNPLADEDDDTDEVGYDELINDEPITDDDISEVFSDDVQEAVPSDGFIDFGSDNGAVCKDGVCGIDASADENNSELEETEIESEEATQIFNENDLDGNFDDDDYNFTEEIMDAPSNFNEELDIDLDDIDELSADELENGFNNNYDTSSIKYLLDEDDEEVHFFEDDDDQIDDSPALLRDVFDDDLDDAPIIDDDLDDIEVESILEPEDEDDELVELDIDDDVDSDEVLQLNEMDEATSIEESDDDENVPDDVEVRENNTFSPKQVDMINAINSALDKIDSDDSDLENYGYVHPDEDVEGYEEEAISSSKSEIEAYNDSLENKVSDFTDDSDDSETDIFGNDESIAEELVDEIGKNLDDVENESFRTQNPDEDIEEEDRLADELVSEQDEEDDDISFVEPQSIKVIEQPVTKDPDKFEAIENNRIFEEEVPTIESLWPQRIIDIVDMSEDLDASPFFKICKENDIELLEAIDHLINQALDLQKQDNKDKMFTIPESNLSIILPINKNDQLKRWERMNSLGALMYSKDMDSWNVLTLNFDDDKTLKSIKEWEISKDSYSSVDWKFVVTTGSRLKKKKK